MPSLNDSTRDWIAEKFHGRLVRHQPGMTSNKPLRGIKWHLDGKPIRISTLWLLHINPALEEDGREGLGNLYDMGVEMGYIAPRLAMLDAS